MVKVYPGFEIGGTKISPDAKVGVSKEGDVVVTTQPTISPGHVEAHRKKVVRTAGQIVRATRTRAGVEAPISELGEEARIARQAELAKQTTTPIPTTTATSTELKAAATPAPNIYGAETITADKPTWMQRLQRLPGKLEREDKPFKAAATAVAETVVSTAKGAWDLAKTSPIKIKQKFYRAIFGWAEHPYPKGYMIGEQIREEPVTTTTKAATSATVFWGVGKGAEVFKPTMPKVSVSATKVGTAQQEFPITYAGGTGKSKIFVEQPSTFDISAIKGEIRVGKKTYEYAGKGKSYATYFDEGTSRLITERQLTLKTPTGQEIEIVTTGKGAGKDFGAKTALFEKTKIGSKEIDTITGIKTEPVSESVYKYKAITTEVGEPAGIKGGQVGVTKLTYEATQKTPKGPVAERLYESGGLGAQFKGEWPEPTIKPSKRIVGGTTTGTEIKTVSSAPATEAATKQTVRTIAKNIAKAEFKGATKLYRSGKITLQTATATAMITKPTQSLKSTPRIAEKLRTAQISTPAQKPKPSQDIKQILRPTQDITRVPKLTPTSITRIAESTITKPITKAPTIARPFTTPPFTPTPPTPVVPIPFILPGGRGRIKQSKYALDKQPRQYQPSVTAIGLQITAPKLALKKRLSKTKFLSGLGIRPIPK